MANNGDITDDAVAGAEEPIEAGKRLSADAVAAARDFAVEQPITALLVALALGTVFGFILRGK
jgi:hypothetical protein